MRIEEIYQTNPNRFPLAEYNHYSTNQCQLLMKRMVDIVLSLILLFILCPIIILTAIAIKITSKGPIVFTQDRLGLRAKKF